MKISFGPNTYEISQEQALSIPLIKMIYDDEVCDSITLKFGEDAFRYMFDLNTEKLKYDKDKINELYSQLCYLQVDMKKFTDEVKKLFIAHLCKEYSLFYVDNNILREENIFHFLSFDGGYFF